MQSPARNTGENHKVAESMQTIGKRGTAVLIVNQKRNVMFYQFFICKMPGENDSTRRSSRENRNLVFTPLA